MPIVELTIDASGALTGAKQYDQATSQISTSTTKAESAISKMRTTVNRLGPIVAAGAAAAGTAFVAIGKKAIDAASAMEETQNKFDVVFDGMTEKAEEWADNLVDNYSMTAEEAKRFLASTQDLLKPMGVAADQAGEMSNSVAQLSADLGSFNNLPTEQVMSDIQSALVGNYETMKKYGVVLNATAVEQEAYTSGLAKQGEELTAAHKAQAAYQLILQGTKDAQGDLARSSGSYANLLKELNANFGNLLITLGEKFLPIATQVLEKIVEWTSNQENLNKVIDAAIETLRFMYNAYKGIEVALKATVVAVAKFAEVTVKAFRTIMKPFDILFKGIEKLGGPKNPFELATEAVEDFSASAIEAMVETWDEIENGNQYFDDLKTSTEETKQATDELVGSQSDLTMQGGEANDMLGVQVEKMNEVADASKKVEESAGGSTRMWNAMLNSLQMIQNSLLQVVNLLQQMANSNQNAATTAQTAASQTQNFKRATDQLGTSAMRTASNVGAMAGAMQAAAAAGAAGGGMGGGGGGKGYKTGMTGQRSGRFNLPSWFSPEMVSAYGRHASDVLIKGTPHLPGYNLGPGMSPSRSMRDRRSEARREWYRQQYDPMAFARRYLSQEGLMDPWGRVRTESGMVININQEMSKDQIEALIAELERAGKRQ